MKIFYFIIAIAFFFGSCKNVCFKKNKNNFILKTSKNKFEISPCGGRIVSYSSDSLELLTSINEHMYFGSTFWVAPQKDWNWPPHPVLDEKMYTTESVGDTLLMKSENDLKSGFAMEKRFYFKNDSCISINYKIKNIGNKVKSFAGWEVTRVTCNGLVFFPMGEKASLPKSNLQDVDTLLNTIWFSAKPEKHGKGQKMFSSAKYGWLAYIYKNHMFIKEFQDTKPYQYSPAQGEIEIFAENNGVYMELENHGPYTFVQPGKELDYKVNWWFFKMNDTVKVQEKEGLIKYVNSIVQKL